MSGQFSAHITTSLIVGIIISFPYFVWEMWRFIKPALHKNEKNKVRGVVIFTSLLFFIGVLLLLGFANPDNLSWFPVAGIQDASTFDPEWSNFKKIWNL